MSLFAGKNLGKRISVCMCVCVLPSAGGIMINHLIVLTNIIEEYLHLVS